MSSPNSQIVTARALEAQPSVYTRPRIGTGHFKDYVKKTVRVNGSRFMENIFETLDYPLNNPDVKNVSITSIHSDDSKLFEITVSDDKRNGFDDIDEELSRNPFNINHNRKGHADNNETSQFGGGLKNGAISIANRMEVFTKSKDGYRKVDYDITAMITERDNAKSFDPLIKESNIEEYNEFHPWGEGSTIRIFDILPVYSNKSKEEFTRDIKKGISEIYKGLLLNRGNDIKVTVNEELIQVTPYIYDLPSVIPFNSYIEMSMMEKADKTFLYAIKKYNRKEEYFIYEHRWEKIKKRAFENKIKDMIELGYEYKKTFTDKKYCIKIISSYTEFLGKGELTKNMKYILRNGRLYGKIPEELSRNGSDNYTCTYVHTESKDLVVDIGLTHYKTIRPDKENPTLIYEALMQIIDINTKPFNSDCSTLANEKLVKIAEENELPNVTEYRSKVENSKRKKNKKKTNTKNITNTVIDAEEEVETRLNGNSETAEAAADAAAPVTTPAATTAAAAAAEKAVAKAVEAAAKAEEEAKTKSNDEEDANSEEDANGTAKADGEEDANDTAKADDEEEVLNSRSDISVKVKTTRRAVKGYDRLIEKTEKEMWTFIAELRCKYTDAEIQEKIANASDSVIPELAKAIEVFENFS